MRTFLVAVAVMVADQVEYVRALILAVSESCELYQHSTSYSTIQTLLIVISQPKIELNLRT
jgi:hypothetical protein